MNMVIDGIVSVLGRFFNFKEKEDEVKQALAVVLMDYEKSVVQAVNTTMQAEAKSEHWLQWSWRPMIGYTCGVTIINNYVLLPYFVSYGLQPIQIPSEVWMVMMAVLGLAAYTRGQEKLARLK